MQVQKLKKDLPDEFKVAQKYYQILSVVNNLSLSKGELQLTAFAAIRGNISLGNIREEYCSKYKTSVATINNTVHRLKRKHIIVKKDNLLIVNPVLNALKFNRPMSIVVTLSIETLEEAPDTNLNEE